MPGSLQPKTSQAYQQSFCRRHSIVIGLEATRISNLLYWHFERVAFPGEYPMFEAPSGTELQLFQLGSHTHP